VDYAELGRPQVYGQEYSLSTAAITLRTQSDLNADPLTTSNSSSGVSNFIYYTGKQNLPAPPGNSHFPGGECPAHDYGTDTHVWDNYGVPNCWKNYVPTIGYDVPGICVSVEGDAVIGLQTEGMIGGGDVYRVTFQTLYGYRLQPDLVLPPVLTVQTVGLGEDGCGEFLWRLKNINPNVPGEVPVSIEEFFIDVEAGDGGETCATMAPPEGWQVETCQGPVFGHVLYRFSGGPPIQLQERVEGRLRIDTNGLKPTVNPQTLVEVPPLSVILHAAQEQEEAVCNFSFGPTQEGAWGLKVVATAYLPVPAMSMASKAVAAVLLAAAGWLIQRRTVHRGQFRPGGV
jgi:hypothetical protein